MSASELLERGDWREHPAGGGHADVRQGGGHPDTTGQGEDGPASQRVIVGYGFWIFLLSDIIMFSAFFASYAVLADSTAGGPAAHDLFNLNSVALETGCLLASSFMCGMATLAVRQRNQLWTQLALLATGLLGAAFLSL